MDPTLTLNDWPGENVLEMSTRSLLSDINILLHQRFFFERINYIYIYICNKIDQYFVVSITRLTGC